MKHQPEKNINKKIKEEVVSVLQTIPDPELNISIWELGLIYQIEIDPKQRVKITMTLTSIGCPLFNLISEPIKQEISKITDVDSVDVELTFDPPWTMERMSAKAKAELGIS